MKCRYSENDIALFVEGDLTAARHREIDSHLVACDACRDVAVALRESQAVFKTLRQDAVSAAALASVRSRVLAEVNASGFRGTWARWIYAVSGAVLALIVGAVWAAYKQLEPPAVEFSTKFQPPAVPAVAGMVPEAAVPKPVPVRKPTSRPSRARPADRVIVAAQPEARPAKPLLMKLFTDDPNIVIYWLLDDSGGTL